MKKLILIFIGSLLVVILESLTIIFYSKIIYNLDNYIEIEEKYLLLYIIFLLINYLLYIIIFRVVEAYTTIFSFKLISQLDALIYDKLLRSSPYNNITEDTLFNFIHFETKNLGEFFSYIPAILIIPFKIIFFIYLLFSYFGFYFIFILIILIFIFVKYNDLQRFKNKYQKIIKSKKEKRLKTTSQVFEKIQIVKLFSWEDYFLKKIRKEREEELIFFKKLQIISFLLDNIKWIITPFLSFISFFLYNLFNEPMKLYKLIISLFIFHKLTGIFLIIPQYINGFNNSLFSFKRIESFLYSKEYNPNQIIIKHKKNKNKNKKEKDKKSNKNSDKDIPIEVLDTLITNSDEKNNINIEKEKEKSKEKEKEIMIDIDDIDFGIIKKPEEFMLINVKEKEINDEIINNKSNKEELDIELELIDDAKSNEKNKKEKLLHQNQKEDNKKQNLHHKKEIVKNAEIINILKGIKLKIFDGDLIGIIGKKGSGKSCLFNAILNNIDILNGPNKKIILNGSIGYIPQNPWALNDTIRNNIIFNKSFNEEKYNIIIKICQLNQDLESLEYNDLTIINDKEDILSTSQKIKINIARALYSEPDIYLFDDIFSTLDIANGKNIFEKVIKDYLKGKTVLLITNKEQYLSMMDNIIIMNEGEIKYYGYANEAKNLYKDIIIDNITKNYNENKNIKKHKKQKKKNL